MAKQSGQGGVNPTNMGRAQSMINHGASGGGGGDMLSGAGGQGFSLGVEGSKDATPIINEAFERSSALNVLSFGLGSCMKAWASAIPQLATLSLVSSVQLGNLAISSFLKVGSILSPSKSGGGRG